MSSNLPILGRGCVHPRAGQECLIEVQGGSDALLDTLPPGVALSSLGLHLHDATSQSQPPQSSLSALAPGSRTMLRTRSTARYHTPRFRTAGSTTTSTNFAKWDKQARHESLIFHRTAQSSQQQAFLSINGRNSPIPEEPLCLNGGGEFFSNQKII